MVLLFAGGSFPLLAEDIHIDLTIYDNGSTFKMGFSNSECPGKPGDLGCIEAARGNSPVISWELDADSSEDWELTRLQFSPDGNNWGKSGHPLQACTVKDFKLSNADRNTGNASTAKVVSNGRRLQIHDLNNNSCRTHYKLFARPKAGGAEINSDPVIDNRGR
jgi:hypothetical protein